jgi:hypothetical protein
VGSGARTLSAIEGRFDNNADINATGLGRTRADSPTLFGRKQTYRNALRRSGRTCKTHIAGSIPAVASAFPRGTFVVDSQVDSHAGKSERMAKRPEDEELVAAHNRFTNEFLQLLKGARVPSPPRTPGQVVTGALLGRILRLAGATLALAQSRHVNDT